MFFEKEVIFFQFLIFLGWCLYEAVGGYYALEDFLTYKNLRKTQLISSKSLDGSSNTEISFGHPHDMFFSTINTLKYFTHYIADARETYDKLAGAVSKVKLETYLSEKMFNVFYNIDDGS